VAVEKPTPGALGAALGAKIGDAIADLPDTLGFAGFVFLMDDNGTFGAVVVANAPPGIIASVVRSWLERYDAGEA
jgi:hypothetical protein